MERVSANLVDSMLTEMMSMRRNQFLVTRVSSEGDCHQLSLRLSETDRLSTYIELGKATPLVIRIDRPNSDHWFAMWQFINALHEMLMMYVTRLYSMSVVISSRGSQSQAIMSVAPARIRERGLLIMDSAAQRIYGIFPAHSYGLKQSTEPLSEAKLAAGVESAIRLGMSPDKALLIVEEGISRATTKRS